MLLKIRFLVEQRPIKSIEKEVFRMDSQCLRFHIVLSASDYVSAPAIPASTPVLIPR